MRGKLHIGDFHRCPEGITPAHAGKTNRLHTSSRTRRDHPRVCGENFQRAESEKARLGSPPRVRGKRDGKGLGRGRRGITPACAGKTRWQRLGQRATRDHPRVCGENRISVSETTSCRGSPPRVRGKQSGIPHRIFAVGITPACAGKTDRRDAWTRRERDHPRVCGENSTKKASCCDSEGSPPRVRGKPRRLTVYECLVGITPACAGKTQKSRSAALGRRDHPRVCGENRS